jgi:arylsulfatase A-like enzyme
MFGSPGPMLTGWKLEEILPTLSKKSCEWITQQSKTKKPFFLYVPLTSPHIPIATSEKFRGKSGISNYADFVIETDSVVGNIMTALEQSGAAKNTLVIFSTDNGTASAANFKDLEKHGVDLHSDAADPRPPVAGEPQPKANYCGNDSNDIVAPA